jgi:hypothetical protein
MSGFTQTLTSITHVIYARLRAITPDALLEDDPDRPDRGAVSLEQALWYAAAAASVGVVSLIIWNTIRDEAETPVQPGGL